MRPRPTQGLTPLPIWHPRRRYAERVVNRVIIDTPLRIPQLPILAIQVGVRIRIPLVSILVCPRSARTSLVLLEDLVARFRVGFDVLLFRLVDIFQLGLKRIQALLRFIIPLSFLSAYNQAIASRRTLTLKPRDLGFNLWISALDR